MKKKIVTLVMASMLFAGAVSAASVWGTYKGNQIIRITSNGVALKTPDVPAIIYNGRTMIPINMLGQLGVGYSWDAKNQTVDVKTASTGTTRTSLDAVKSNIRYADYFHSLETFGDMMVGLSSRYSTAYNFASINSHQTANVLSDINKTLNELIETYNQLNSFSTGYISDPNVKSILDGYYSAIEQYKKTADALTIYSVTKSSTSFKEYTNSSNKAFSLSSDARYLASITYTAYINAALNSK